MMISWLIVIVLLIITFLSLLIIVSIYSIRKLNRQFIAKLSITLFTILFATITLSFLVNSSSFYNWSISRLQNTNLSNISINNIKIGHSLEEDYSHNDRVQFGV